MTAEDTKLTLWCGVFNDQSIFSVRVARDATVEALQQAIFTKKRGAERYRFDASRLKLFLARTPEGAWLKGADARGVLAGKPDDTEYKLMDPCLELSRPECFGGVEIGEDDEEIHVLVHLPDDAARGGVGASELAKEVANAVKEEMVQKVTEEVAQTIKEGVAKTIKEEMAQTVKNEVAHTVKNEVGQTVKEEVTNAVNQVRDEMANGAAEWSEVVKVVKDLQEEVADFRDRMVRAKHKRFVHSEITLTKGRTLLLELKTFVKPVGSVPIPPGISSAIQPFNWERMAVDERGAEVAPTEQQQREWRRAYVEDAIGDVLTEKNLYVRSVNKDERVLSVRIPGTDVILEGRTDMLVLGKIVQQSKHYLPMLPDARLLIETKKAVQSDPHMYEVLSELIALDFLADEPVMALLTNLTSHWQFFWVAEKRDDCAIIQTTTIQEPGAAFALIRALLKQSPAADLKLPSLQAPVKRRKLAKELATITESVGGSGVREAIERYYDVASELGPDVELARATADQIVRAIPMFSHLP